MISKHDNIWKSNKDPKPYFQGQPGVMDSYLIPPEFLDYHQFPQFLEARREKIWERVRTFLGIQSDEDGLPAQALAAEPSTPSVDLAQAPAVDERVLIRRVFTRIPVPDGPRMLFRALWDAGEEGLSLGELATTMHRTRHELAGVLGALGKRINRTEGVAATHPGAGIGLFLEWWRERGEWCYRLRPTFRQALADDAELARLALGREG